MILNIPGAIRTGKIRDIPLFEFDFNFASKLYFGSRLMKRAKIPGVLTQDQHGGRSLHTLIKVSVLISMLF